MFWSESGPMWSNIGPMWPLPHHPKWSNVHQNVKWQHWPPAAAGEAGDATSQPARACARGQMAPGADRGCPGSGRCAWSRARPQRGRVPRARAWARARRAPRTNSPVAEDKFAARGGPAAAACRRPRRQPAHRRIPWVPARGLAAVARVIEPAAAP